MMTQYKEDILPNVRENNRIFWDTISLVHIILNEGMEDT